MHKGGNVSYWVPSVGEEEYTEERTARSPIDTTLVAPYLFHNWHFLMPYSSMSQYLISLLIDTISVFLTCSF